MWLIRDKSNSIIEDLLVLHMVTVAKQLQVTDEENENIWDRITTSTNKVMLIF